MDTFDYLIIGAGASGLMLAEAMGRDPWFRGKRIGLIEKDGNKGNDRTWCFWEKGSGSFDSLLHRSWDRVQVAGPGFRRMAELAPYRYKMIRASDFYQEYNARLSMYPNIIRLQGTVRALKPQTSCVEVDLDGSTLRAGHVLSSVRLPSAPAPGEPHPVLQQHFTGWVIRASDPVFDSLAPTFMDFDIAQKGNTRFMYLLPYSDREGLVEYTLFSENLLPPEEYQAALKKYIRETLGCSDYEILETETGSIPMTCNDFTRGNSPRLTHIGIAGGWAKPSTGYTFWNTAQNTPRVIAALKAGKAPEIKQSRKFWWYDRLLLDALARENEKGGAIFSSQLRKLPLPLLFSFLNEETHLRQDLQIIWSCPKGPLLRAALKALF